ncbi:hypothetical protein [Streptomyces sp. NBC_00035]|uniref:hypothetical protein n=1 Tax=Streptomyces sp. NBC_00035 TaxID=2903614 RepID=UPI003246A46E
MRRFNELDADLPAQKRALAEALRNLFFLLDEPLNGYAKRLPCDKGAMSRYLAGRRIPPWKWVCRLHREALEKTIEDGAVMAESALQNMYHAALGASSWMVHQNTLPTSNQEPLELLLRAPQQPEVRQQPRPEPKRVQPELRPVPSRLAQVSAEIESFLHAERLPKHIRELQALERHAEVLELLNVVARRPVPQALYGLRCLERDGLAVEVNFLVGFAANRPPQDAAKMAETLLGSEKRSNVHLLKNFLSALSRGQPTVVADTARQLAIGDGERRGGRELCWELLLVAGNRSVEDIADIMAALGTTGMGTRGVRAVFSGESCHGEDRCSKTARLLRLLKDKGCTGQQETVIEEVVNSRIEIDEIIGMVNALHEVRLRPLAEDLGPRAVRARADRRWRDKLARALRRAGLTTEAELVRQAPLA